MEVNKTLLEYMEHTTIGEAFKYLAPFLKLYSSYANNHENAINLLQVKKMEIYLDKDMQFFVYFSHRIMYRSKLFPWYLVHIYLASCYSNVFWNKKVLWIFDILQEWRQKSSGFHEFIQNQEEKADMMGLKINALLITPVQRVPR